MLLNPYKLTIYQGFHNREELKRYLCSTGSLLSLLVLKSRQIVVWMRYETERQNKQNKQRTDQNGKQ
jgi:hypothetical protein